MSLTLYTKDIEGYGEDLKKYANGEQKCRVIPTTLRK